MCSTKTFAIAELISLQLASQIILIHAIIIICENFVVKKNSSRTNDENSLHENFFTSNAIYDKYMAHMDMNKNIVIQKFLIKICEQNINIW